MEKNCENCKHKGNPAKCDQCFVCIVSIKPAIPNPINWEYQEKYIKVN